MAIIRNPEFSKGYWMPDNSFAVSGMTLRIKWDSSGSVPFKPPVKPIWITGYLFVFSNADDAQPDRLVERVI